MKRLFPLLMLVVFSAGCGGNTTPAPNGTEPDMEPGDVDVPKTCPFMSCPAGCCDARCVNFQTDRNNCGRCGTRCDHFCLNGTCVTECAGEHARVCKGVCVDLSTNEENCGTCGNVCGPNMKCTEAGCACIDGYSDCDGNALNGCESAVVMCACTNGDVVPCYPGPAGTQDVGVCRAGTATCEDGIFMYCENYVIPSVEKPDNGVDDDCDGEVDERIDEDGDGYYAGEDCCDSRATCMVAEPEKVNPGAKEIVGNGIDDDCDGMIDEVDEELCSTSAHVFEPNTALTQGDALLLAQAMDICDEVSRVGYGLISAELLLADGTPLPKEGDADICSGTTVALISPAEQVSVVTNLGGVVQPLKGTMAMLSSGRAQGKENTNHKNCVGTEVVAPEVFLAAHHGLLPVTGTCSGVPQKHKMANDSVMLRLKLKAPSNAKGFSFRFKFFSKEFPGYVCSDYNDFFLALTDAQDPSIPADRNVSFDTNHQPVSVNNAFFTECEKSACVNVKRPEACVGCTGISGAKAYSDSIAVGATGWLKTSVPVQPNEEFTLDLMVFDGGDRPATKKNGYGHQKDSSVLLDAFEWEVVPTQLVTEVN